jgi:hypothetical protein
LVIKRSLLGQDGWLEGGLTTFRKELCSFLRRKGQKLLRVGPQFALRNGAKESGSGASLQARAL